MVVTKIVKERIDMPQFGFLKVAPEREGRLGREKVARGFLLWCRAGLCLKSRRAGNGGGGTQKQADKEYSDAFHSTVRRADNDISNERAISVYRSGNALARDFNWKVLVWTNFAR
jgi:hypothetical protein